MPESFGGRLRQQRERRQIALETIADQTKIKLSLLEGLERDEISHWPTGIFRRAFIRAYALAIGLEPDAVVREFLERHPDPAEIVAIDASLRPDVDRVPEGVAPPTRFRYLVSSAIGTLAKRRAAAAAERGHAVPVPSVIDPPQANDFSVMEVRSTPARFADAEPCRDVDAVSLVTTEAIADAWSMSEVTVALDATADVEPAPIVEAASVAASPSVPAEPDFEAAAYVCTELGRAVHTHDVAPLLGRAAAVLDAVGLIVWAWDPQASALRATVAHGYSDRVLAQLPAVRRDAANATAAAFRTAQPCSVAGNERASGALVAPLITPDGCVGVLTIEWPLGREQSASIRSMATIFAALVARWLSAIAPADVANRRLA